MKKNTFKSFIHIVVILMLLFFNIPTYSAELPPSSDTSKAPQVEAQSAILMDAKTGEILFEKNSTLRQYPASITKLMTALLAIENLKPSDTITFSEDAIYGIEPDSSHIGMRVGEQITVDQALHGLLLMSANEVANGIAEKVSGSIENFAVAMTQKSRVFRS